MADPTGPSYPAASKYQADVATGYVARRAKEPTWAWEDEQVRAFVAGLPTGLDVLDVPVGTGRYVPIYLDAGWAVHGCDISSAMLAEAEQQLGSRHAACDMVLAPAEDMPFHDGSMDAIVSGRFLQWLPDLPSVDAVVAELARVGRSEALVQIRIPARPPSRPTVRGSLVDAARALRRGLRGRRGRPLAASITAHREAAVLDLFRRHGWRLHTIGEECPSDPGLRFYRFQRDPAKKVSGRDAR